MERIRIWVVKLGKGRNQLQGHYWPRAVACETWTHSTSPHTTPPHTWAWMTERGWAEPSPASSPAAKALRKLRGLKENPTSAFIKRPEERCLGSPRAHPGLAGRAHGEGAKELILPGLSAPAGCHPLLLRRPGCLRESFCLGHHRDLLSPVHLRT